jgi:gluconokinase
MLLVLFGVPGAGKSYVGHILRDSFGFTFHDADHDLPDDMRHALANKLPVTDDMRDRFFSRVIASTARLSAANECLVIAQAFMKERHRRLILDHFPDAQFVLIETELDLILQRFQQRKSYLIDAEDALRIANTFEPPRIPHHVIQNSNGREAVVRQLCALLEIVFGLQYGC